MLSIIARSNRFFKFAKQIKELRKAVVFIWIYDIHYSIWRQSVKSSSISREFIVTKLQLWIKNYLICSYYETERVKLFRRIKSSKWKYNNDITTNSLWWWSCAFSCLSTSSRLFFFLRFRITSSQNVRRKNLK